MSTAQQTKISKLSTCFLFSILIRWAWLSIPTRNQFFAKVPSTHYHTIRWIVRTLVRVYRDLPRLYADIYAGQGDEQSALILVSWNKSSRGILNYTNHTNKRFLILIVADINYVGIHLSQYWIPIHYDTIEDGQNKKSHLLYQYLENTFKYMKMFPKNHEITIKFVKSISKNVVR